MQKLPNADYDSVIEGSVSKAIRRFLSRQILIGDGTTANLKGIFYNPTKAAEQVIDPATDIETITAIDDGTLDERYRKRSPVRNSVNSRMPFHTPPLPSCCLIPPRKRN